MTAEGRLAFDSSLTPLKRISPTQFLALRQCRLRVLWAANRVKPLLPMAPASRVGTAVHSLLQEAGQGRFIGDPLSINDRWRELVAHQEGEMSHSWMDRHLVPLGDSLPDFEVRAKRALTRARDITEMRSAAGATAPGPSRETPPTGFEMRVATKDGLVAGRIDAVVAAPGGPIIRDYKSGGVLEFDDQKLTLRAEHRDQLRLYAALYAESYDVWPSAAVIVPVAGDDQYVNVDRHECRNLLVEARTALHDLNRTIRGLTRGGGASEGVLASPTPESCTLCPYRPGCPAYRLSHSSWGLDAPADAIGVVDDCRTLGNGSVLARLASPSDRTVAVRGLQAGAERHPALAYLTRGAHLGAYSLRRDRGSSSSYLEGPFTTLYIEPTQYTGGSTGQ